MAIENKTTMKYIAYYRVSTKGQGESGLGLDAQKQIVNHYFSSNEIVKEFTEVASAKTVGKRPLLIEAIFLCESKGYTLLVAKTDRLSRVTEQALKVYNRLNGRLHSCDIPQQKGAMMDKFTLTLFMAISDRERELIGIRTRQALSSKKKQGVKLGKPENLTDKAKEKGLKVRQENARMNKANRQAKELANAYRAQGMTLTMIADKINDLGMKTRRGKTFQATSIKRLLDN